MLQLDPTTQANLEAATTPSARAAAILSSLSGTITVTVRDGAGATKGSGTMASFGTQSANVIVLNNVTSFTVSETGTPDPTTWTIEFATAGGRFVKGTFGLYTSPFAEFKWSLDSWENGQTGTIASAYCTVRKNEVLSDVTDTFEVASAPVNTAPSWVVSRPTSLSGTAGTVLQLAQYAYDPDGGNLTYSISSYIPPGYSINATTGALTIGTTTQPVTIRVTDPGGLSADWVVTVTVTSQPPVESIIKWNPGHYVNTSRAASTTVAARVQIYDAAAPYAPTYVKGATWFAPWSLLQPTKGDLTTAITLIGEELARLRARNMKMILVLHDSLYSACLPQYIQDEGYAVTWSGRTRWDYTNTTARNYWKALVTAIGNVFDGDPDLEAFRIGQETSHGALFGEAASTAAYKDMALHAKSVFPNTIVHVPVNWGIAWSDFFTWARTNAIAVGNPDTCPSCAMTADETFRGAIGGTDYRLTTPLFMGCETSTLGANFVGPDGGFTAAQIYAYANNTMKASHLSWDRNTTVGTAAQQWGTTTSGGILQTIIENPITNIDAPPNLPMSETEIKWNPGHYMMTQLGTSDPADQSIRFGYYDQIANEPQVEGACWYLKWSEVESTQGNYTAGLAYMRSELNKLKSLSPYPKRLYVRMVPQYYGTRGLGTSYVPAYIVNAGGWVATDKGGIIKVWDATIRNHYINLLRAIATEFNDEPYFEGIVINRETATGDNVDGGFTWDGYTAGWKAVALAAKQAFTKTNVTMFANFGGGYSQSWMNDLVAYLASIGVGVGGPDTCADCNILTYATLLGSNGTEYRATPSRPSLLPVHYAVEGSEMGYNSVGPTGGYTATEVMNFADGTLRPSHFFWIRMTDATVATSEQLWTTGVLPVIRTRPLTYTLPPTGYGA